jgi:oligopeptide/dipeptide ABC transporter ATP-binding protein
VIAEVADDVVVMYGGKVVEQASVNAIFESPQHPYTWGLLGSLPRLHQEGDRLEQIPGQPPSLLRPPPGCAFHPRCAYTMDRCRTEIPPLIPWGDGDHVQRCLLEDATRQEIWAAKKASMKVEAA